MKLLRLFLITILAIAIGACGGAATEQKNVDDKDAANTEKNVDDKTDEVKPAETGKVADTPTAAVENFVEGVKAKDETAMRNAISADTLKIFDLMAKEEKKTFYEIMTTEDEESMKKMPEIRNEKIEGDKATAELKEPDKDQWTNVNFVKENGSWKLSLFSEKEAEEMMKKMEGLKELEKKAEEIGDDKKADGDADKK